MDLLSRINKLTGNKFSSLIEVLQYYREVLPKRCPDDFEEELGPVFLQERDDLAELFLKRVFCLGDSCIDMSKKLDWQTAAKGDLEWTCTLARHHHFPVMAREYAKYKDDRYAKEMVSQFIHWINNVPKPQDSGNMEYFTEKRSNWRPLETAFRLGETWPIALTQIIESKELTPEDYAQILLSLHEQAAYLNLHRWKIGNHSIMEASMLAIYSIIFREFEETEKWLDECIQFLTNSFDMSFYPDGYSREMSGGYRWVMVKGYITLWEILQKNDFTKLLPEGFATKIKEVATAELYHLKPDFSVPVTNESNSTARRKNQLQRTLKSFNDEELRFVLSKGDKGKFPKYTSYYYKDANIAIMRSDWSEKALYLSFDMGAKGLHSIGDQLSVDISALGRKFIANCGRWRYTSSPGGLEWMDWAEYFKSSAACNTVMPKNSTQVLSDATGEMEINNDYDYAKGVFNGGYIRNDKIIQIRHQREILFIKPYFWIIKDSLFGRENEEDEIEQLWHFLESEKCVRIISSANAVVTNNKDANIIVIPLASNTEMKIFKGQDNPFRGWQCPKYAQKIPAFELVLSKRGKFPMVFETLLLPVRGQAEEMPEFYKDGNTYIVKYSGMRWRITGEGNQFTIRYI